MASVQRKLLVPAFWDDEFLEELDSRGFSQHIYEIYGSLPASFMGTMLTRASLPEVNPEGIEDYVKKLHARNIKFSYALNALAMGNLEYTSEGQQKIFAFLEWLGEIDVDSVIVSNPFLATLIMKHFPSFEVSVSSAACVDSIPKAKFWEEMGVSNIKLPLVVNRNFSMLNSLAKSIKVDLEVMVSQLCLYQCPMERYHTVTTNTDSQVIQKEGVRSFMDWCRLQCNLIRWSNPVELIKSPIVRPEDVALYQSYGIKYFKIVGRNRNMRNKIMNVIQAYVDRKWVGNLLDIVGVNTNPPPYELKQFYPESEFERYFLEPLYYIDNAKLDGFIDYFLENGYRCLSMCGTCRYCEEVAGRVITLPSKERLEQFLHALKELESASESKVNHLLAR